MNTDRLKLELRRARRPAMQYIFLTGVFIFCAAIVLKNQFYNRFWQDKFTFKAAFTSAKGVTPGVQRVKIAGVQAGVVSKSEVKDGRAVLTIKLDKKYGPIYKDAHVRLRPLTPLQDMYVSIDSRGHKSAGTLTQSDILPSDRTVSPVDISNVLDNFPEATRTRLHVLLDQFGRGLQDRGASLRAALGELAPFLTAAQRTASIVADRRTETARLVHNLSRLTSALGRRDRAVAEIVKEGNTTLASLSSADRELGSTLSEIPPTLDTISSSFAKLRDAEGELDPAISSLKPVADKLTSGLSALKQFGADATPALSALRPAMTELHPLATDLKPTATSLSQAMTSFRPQAPEFDRITALIPPCFDQIGNFFNDTLSVLKFSDAYGSFPRGDDQEDANTLGSNVAPIKLKKSPTCVQGGTK